MKAITGVAAYDLLPILALLHFCNMRADRSNSVNSRLMTKELGKSLHRGSLEIVERLRLLSDMS